MSEKKVKLKLGDKEVNATEVSVNQVSERWNEYFIDDGSVLKLKPVVTKVYRIDNEYDAEGNPVYFAQSTNVLTVSAPDDLKRKGG